MKNFLIALLTVFCSLGLFVDDAQARRLGGGKSFGMQRSAPAPSRQNAAPAQTPGKPAQAAPASSGNRWLGPIAGLAAGIGLAALFSHLGLGEGMASVVMILLLVMAAVFVFRLLTRRTAAPNQPLQFAGPDNAPAAAPVFEAPASAGSGATGSVLPGFDSATFLREAKLNFLRLQKANDDSNLDDLREFTTPEVFAEISLQMSERAGAPQRTVIVTLNAELLEVVEEGAQYVASVRFSGLIREMSGAAPDDLDEVWHLTKPVEGNRGWAIAGIQQARA